VGKRHTGFYNFTPKPNIANPHHGACRGLYVSNGAISIRMKQLAASKTVAPQLRNRPLVETLAFRRGAGCGQMVGSQARLPQLPNPARRVAASVERIRLFETVAHLLLGFS
jgi:hypothetical protein